MLFVEIGCWWHLAAIMALVLILFLPARNIGSQLGCLFLAEFSARGAVALIYFQPLLFKQTQHTVAVPGPKR